jgi:uncharacterized repeat protein (TIGR03847 family)
MAPHPVDRFVPGFIGVPGDRAFYFEVGTGPATRWFLLEKGQVAAFAVEAARLLASNDLGRVAGDLALPEITEPDEVTFRVGEMRIAYDEAAGLVSLDLVATGDEDENVTVWLTPGQLEAAARTGAESVGQGRPLCPRCGLAMDPEGHPCPVTNGDLRGHRP